MLVVLRALAMAHDEVNWLLRHMHAAAPKCKAKLDPRIFHDPYASSPSPSAQEA